MRDPDRIIERKIKEIIQSVRVTDAYPGEEGKQQIITAYLNQNYYGNGLYGIKAAARGYFGVDDLNDLTLGQVALAGRAAAVALVIRPGAQRGRRRGWNAVRAAQRARADRLPPQRDPPPDGRRIRRAWC